MLAAYFVVDPDVRNAHAPPPELYGNRDWYSTIIDRVWRPGWQWLVPVIAEERSAGQVTPLGLVGEPLVHTQTDETEHLLSNVCTHRGALLVDGSCSVRHLRCPYHARTFDLDGRARHSPGFEDTAFPTDRDHLPHAALGQWGPWRFGSVAPTVPFEAWITSVGDATEGYDPGSLVHRAAGHRVHAIEANWAIYVENYLEGLHIPFVHPGLNDVIEPGTYTTTLLPWGTVQRALARDGQPAHATPSGERVAAWYLWLFPGTMVNIYPWGVSMNQVEPVGPTEMRVHYRTWVRDGSVTDPDIDTVELEDQAIVQRVQRGMASRLYQGGRYSPTEERGTHHFHRLLAAALSG